MDCTFCDAPLTPGARFCPNCGASVAQAGPVPAGFAKPAAYPTDPTLYPGPMPPTNSVLAMASIICGILSWFGLFGIGAVLAIVLGHMARREIRDSQGRLVGDPLAVIGLILGYLQVAIIALIVAVIGFVAIFAIWGTH